MIQLTAVSVATGIAAGPALIVESQVPAVPRRHIDLAETTHEISRFRAAIATCDNELADIIAAQFISGEAVAHAPLAPAPKNADPTVETTTILEAQRVMLKDPLLASQTEKLIADEHINAEWATARTLELWRQSFARVESPFFLERAQDLDFLGRRILACLIGHDTAIEPTAAAGRIVFADDLSPADAVVLARHGALAFVTEKGSRTTHAAIVARSFEIPAIAGAKGILQHVSDNDHVIVDATRALVIINPDDATRAEIHTRRKRQSDVRNAALVGEREPCRTACGKNIAVLGNLELVDDVATLRKHGAEGVGLFRTEFMFLGRQSPPTEDEQYAILSRALHDFGTGPFVVRTLDAGSDKPLAGYSTPREESPALGLRGIRLTLRERHLFKAQIRAILRASLEGDLRVLLPMVSGVDELRHFRALCDETRDELARDGLNLEALPPIGVMIEVPAAALCADLLAAEADFLSIGTNDLIQYLLAIDRNSDHVAYLYRPWHPAVLRIIRLVTDAAAQRGKPVAVCGEMAGDPYVAPLLAALNVRTLSMNAASIAPVKAILRATHLDDIGPLVNDLLAATGEADADAMLRTYMDTHYPTFTEHWAG